MSKKAEDGKYAIQVKAFPEVGKDDAMMFVAELRKRQPNVHMERVDIKRRGVWYRVLLGHFADKKEASNYIREKRISDVYPECFVQLKSEGQLP